jgi:Fic/DOC family N-terminal
VCVDGWSDGRGHTIRRCMLHRGTARRARTRPSCPIAGLDLALPGAVVAVVSEAEAAIGALSGEARPQPAPFARLLLRTESIPSSKVEGLQVATRSLARAEAQEATGH